MYGNRAYVDPLVYRDLIQKVVFVGTESTGKSTISAALAAKHNTLCTHEYGRSLWERFAEQGISPTFSDLYKIGRTQYEQEEAAALHANRFLFCDTNPWTTMMWSEMYHGLIDHRLAKLATDTSDEYIWFLCKNDFDWVDDGTRELKDGKAAEFQQLLADTLALAGVQYTILTGSLDERIATVEETLKGLTYDPTAIA
jgi:NadR type nicotinamide-nucleotide adenylyltransferase